ncbi:MAG TPA: c-type cytochrome [Bryobacteraceae bacterium]|nr:c-type cytochrome [Bryobacteraceae bacterium]
MKTLIASAGVISLLMVPGAWAGQPAPTIKKVPVQNAKSITGKSLYREYCAVCHGTTGKGDGPAAPALKTPPADLTQIAKQNGGTFPEVKVQHIISGDTERPVAHGTQDMPIWGNIFRHMGGNQDLGTVRVYNLMRYLEQLQAQ